MGINEQSQKLMDKIRAKKGKPLFLNTVEAVREANIKQYCTNPPLVEIGRTEDQRTCGEVWHFAVFQAHALWVTGHTFAV